MKDYQKDFISFCITHNVLKFGTFTLKSGRISPYFFNAGLFNTGHALHQLGLFYASALNDVLESGKINGCDVLFGPAYKGIPLVSTTVIALSSLFNKDFAYSFNRKEKKDHGEGGSLVGTSDLKGKKVIIIDDVITAGTAIRESMEILKANGAILVGVLIALDRQERVNESTDSLSAIQQVEKDFGVPVMSIVKLGDVLEFLVQGNTNEGVVEDIKAYRAKFGV